MPPDDTGAVTRDSPLLAPLATRTRDHLNCASQGSKYLQCPSETTSTLPSTTVIAVWSSMA